MFAADRFCHQMSQAQTSEVSPLQSKIGTSSVKTSVQTSTGKVILTIGRKCISANLRGSIFKIFWGNMPPDPGRRPKQNFSHFCWLENFVFFFGGGGRLKPQKPFYAPRTQKAPDKLLTVRMFDTSRHIKQRPK